MQVHRDIDRLPRFTNAVITIGTFDGVHTGHQEIIEQLKKEAAAVNGETVIITFHPHPRMVVHEGQSAVPVLTTLEEKIELLRQKGINHLVVVPFNERFAGQTAEEYVTDFLVAKFNPHTIIIGYDHRFGKGRTGDYHLLEDCGRRLGFLVKEIPAQVLDDITVSSTRIRMALLKGDIDTANSCLGYHYHFEGLVVDGNKLGRTLGYPTANIHIHEPEKLVPGNGIYAVNVLLTHGTGSRDQAQQLMGMMSIGVRPTIGTTERTIEVNIFNFNEDIYGRILRVYIQKYLRPELKFNSLEELADALAQDKINALAALASHL